MAPFYGWSSTASRLEPLWRGSLLFTTKFPEMVTEMVPRDGDRKIMQSIRITRDLSRENKVEPVEPVQMNIYLNKTYIRWAKGSREAASEGPTVMSGFYAADSTHQYSVWESQSLIEFVELNL